MPDWSYQTLFRPALFRMPAATAREITLRAFGAIGRCPGGSWLIKTMGHMEYSPRLALKLGPLHVSYPVGCGAGLDMDGVAYRSLSQIGFGLIELGPVTVHPISEGGTFDCIPNQNRSYIRTCWPMTDWTSSSAGAGTSASGPRVGDRGRPPEHIA